MKILTSNSLTVEAIQMIRDNNNDYLEVASHAATALTTTGFSANPALTTFNFYEAIPQKRLPHSSNSPLRVSFEISEDIAAGESFTLDIDYDPTAQFICTIRSENSFDIPKMTDCSHDSAQTYTITLKSGITTANGPRYMIEITNYHSDSPAVTFPTDITPLLLTLTVPVTSAETESTHIAPRSDSEFRNSDFVSLYQSIGEYQNIFTFRINTNLAIPADVSTDEVYIIFEFPVDDSLWEVDLGASGDGFAADAVPYHNGMLLPTTLDAGLGGSAVASLRYGDTTDNTPATITITGHTGMGTGTNFDNLFTYIVNPADDKGLRMNIKILEYPNGQNEPNVLLERSFIHYDTTYTESGDSSPALTVTMSPDGIQQPSSLVLSGKNYGTAVTTTTYLIVKFRN